MEWARTPFGCGVSAFLSMKMSRTVLKILFFCLANEK